MIGVKLYIESSSLTVQMICLPGKFCYVILRKLGPFALRIGEKAQFGVYPFQCKVYVHCIHCVYGHSGVDSKDKFYTFCTLC